MATNYEKLSEIGRGSWAVVYKARWNGQLVAVKQLHEVLFNREINSHAPKAVEVFEKECKLLQNLKHANIVELLTFDLKSSPPVLITELLSVDLESHITNLRPNKVPFKETVSIMSDVAEGLSYLHQRNPQIVHRDLASKNVLLTGTGQAKIADVGLAKVFPPESAIMYGSPTPGTQAYAAPETFPNSHQDQVQYDIKIDIFSFGIILMEIINGNLPSPSTDSPFSKDGRKIPEKERRKQDIDMMGKNKLKDIVLRCIEDKSFKRPHAEELIRMLRLQSSKIRQKEMIANHYGIPTIQLLVLGSVSVGKSSLIARYFDGEFNDRIFVTMSRDIRVTKIWLHDRRFNLKVVDTAGLEKYLSALVTSEFRKSQGIVIAYDVTDPRSLHDGVKKIYELIKDNAADDVSMILVGNKTEEPRLLSEEDGQRYAKNFKIPYIETSAKTGKNVKEMFEMIIKEIDESLDLSDIDSYVTSHEKVQLPRAPPTGAGKPKEGAKSTGSCCLRG